MSLCVLSQYFFQFWSYPCTLIVSLLNVFLPIYLLIHYYFRRKISQYRNTTMGLIRSFLAKYIGIINIAIIFNELVTKHYL